jgi:ribosome-associated protein
VILDVRGRCPFTDFMVLATARSQQLAQMLAGAVLHAVKARAREVAPGVAPAIEGGQQGSEWLVVDAGSVVAHVFLEGYRQEYALEELWGRPDGSNLRRVAPMATLHTLDTLS